ncbi:hypothetical protein [Desulfotomaculum sp. 1211_IL3151]|uniref:hypothetical protein n=1 Tax=Desulfotomaculum sp. 1211_IL3151 TaxID=3084055 RepID=UPI002FDAD696
MNKIKLMYSIAKTMKEKDHFNGSLQVECIKDQAKLFQMTNEFSKNLSSGMVKARIKTEMDYAGKSFKHESSNEFSHGQNPHRHEGFFKDRHARFHHGCCGHFGLKDFFSKLTLALDLLERIKVEEQPDNTTRMTLELDELPKELQALKHSFRKEHRQGQEYHRHHHEHCLMKELHALENPNLALLATINKKNELECIDLKLSGKQAGGLEENHTLNIHAKLIFSNK